MQILIKQHGIWMDAPGTVLVVLDELCNALVFADALVMLCNTL